MTETRTLNRIAGSRRAAVLWIAALMVYVLAGTALVPFHADESTLIMMSRDYAYQFIDGDWSAVRYHEPPLNATEQHLRLLNGTVPKYLIGLAWDVAGYTANDLNEQWLWGAGWDWNVQNGHKPSDGLLRASRWSAALLAALSVPLIFVLAGWWTGRGTAYAASLLLATHGVVLIQARRAYMEGALLVFSLLVLVVAVWWGRRLARFLRHREHILPALALGVSVGLLVASKHSGAVIALAAFGGLLLIMLRTRQRQALLWLVLAGVLSLLVFVALNPAWWDDPLGRPADVLALRAGLLADQTAAFPEDVYAAPWDRLAGMAEQLAIAPPEYYEVSGWADYIGGEIAAYEGSFWAGLRYGDGGLWTVAGIGLFLLMAAGAGRLARDAARSPQATLLIGLWGALVIIFILATIPLNWQRYYMPLYPLEALLAGGGLAGLVGWLRARRA